MGSTRITLEVFVSRAIGAHGKLYDYSQVVYQKHSGRVKIICPEHGLFEQQAALHLNGSGCPKCGREKANRNITIGVDKFIRRANAVHGESRYDYSQVIYKAKSKVKIICPHHGAFEQSPHAHLKGHGCFACGALSARPKAVTNNGFIARCQAIHPEANYDYSQVNYTDSRLKVKIICRTHGVFEQKAISHAAGNGCPACGLAFSVKSLRVFKSKENTSKPSLLYLIKIFNENELFYKVGITSFSINRRYRQGSTLNGYSFEVVATKEFQEPEMCFKWETRILNSFAHLRYTPSINFGGKTECFSSCEEILEIFPL